MISVLDRLGVESMLTGSWASSLHGVPRATHDVDLVVNLQLAQIEPLAKEFPPPDFYLSQPAMRDAVQRKRMFNLLDTVEGDKIDFWLITDSPFDVSRFSRRQASQLAGVRLFVSSPEDTIIGKLLWAEKSGRSEKQFNDALQIYMLQAPSLDHDLMRHWARELKLEAWLQRLETEGQESDDEAALGFP